MLGPEREQGLAPVGRRHDPESVRFERLGEGLAQGGLVLDDQDRSCHVAVLRRFPFDEVFDK